MTHENHPASLSTHMMLALPTTWSPEQALAVLDLLVDLHERIWQHYGHALYDLAREQHPACTNPTDDTNFIDDGDGPPF